MTPLAKILYQFRSDKTGAADDHDPDALIPAFVSD